MVVCLVEVESPANRVEELIYFLILRYINEIQEFKSSSVQLLRHYSIYNRIIIILQKSLNQKGLLYLKEEVRHEKLPQFLQQISGY